ncbi:hypothetical protein BTO15_11655 [Polaribacter sejongensis]|uniref:Protein CR006 P-loop domain-containing protein n=1 Tax=Polaribacter sejongensis TaxID=985043 RepID=A0ABN5F6K5_9FLAO|nr:AAA family ATPase [Polaribacter sejongensis]AUC22703.1 hypothetical protein BTO15_11655 [Polaribacter sejongensis]
MASTTTNKKTIVDFLWEWAENNGEWSKLLISKIVQTENDLINTDRQLVFDYFLQSIKLHSGLTPLKTIKPSYTPTNKKIELETLSNIQGVNRLAKNQSIQFSENLTVIFGENGTGKTGYGRILKTLGYSYDSHNNILSDIYSGSQPQSADIKFKTNSNSQVFNWNGSNKNTDLENISVFNNNCVQITLSDRQLIVTPIGFHLFNLVTSELNKLQDLFNIKISNYPTLLPWVDSLNKDTIQKKYISSLSKTSSDLTLTQISTFSNLRENELKDSENELKDLNKTLLQKEIENINSSILELSTIKKSINEAKTLLNKENWEILINFNEQIKVLESKTKKGIKEIAESNGIDFYETQQFQTFLKSAEEYIKIIDKPDYPTEQDNCVYCLQPLQSTAKELLDNYRNLLNDKTEANLEVIKEKKLLLINQIKKIDTSLNFHQSTYGLNCDNEAIQPNEITEYNKILDKLKTTFTKEKVDKESTFNFDYDKYLKIFNEKKENINETLKIKKELLLNLGQKETQLKSKINELKDRKFISKKTTEIKQVISNHKVLSILNSNINKFNTNSISRKTSEARDELVQSNFGVLFKDELKSFRKSHLKIDLSFGTNRGNSKISHKINSYSLTDILSEGEQKAIALSEFLTELQLDNIKAPVIFDDPVNSLDHNIIDDVAKRLIKLSKERQVVIFTHSVLLFNSFLHFSKQSSFKSLKYKFYNTKNNFKETGFVTEAEEEINKVKSYTGKINTILNNTPKGKSETDLAEDGYGYLRSAIELFVEIDIFQGTVKRYQKNIALTSFLKVDGIKLNQHKEKLNEIFERCCGYIKGHSNPEQIHNDPTLIELKSDFDNFIAIRSSFLN